MKPVLTLSIAALAGLFGFAIAQETGGKKPAAPPSAQEMMKPPAPLEDKFLDSMVGTWMGKGKFMGIDFEGPTRIEWVLGHQFLKGTEKSRGPEWTYESEGFWRKEGEGYRMWWFDSMGGAGTGEGKLVGNVLHSTGTDPMMGPFRGETRMNGPDEMTWAMECDPEKDGTFTKAGEGAMRRMKVSPSETR